MSVIIKKQQYPILEWDENNTSIIEPSKLIKKIEGISEHCVITFFRETIERKKEKGQLKEIARLRCETLEIPVYETVLNGKKICLTLGVVGAALSVGILEELIALGINKFIVCGGAGVLRKDIALGHLMIPNSAVRDEGVSYHYIKPSREIECNKEVLDIIEIELKKRNIPFIKEKTWTTDAFYRETKDKLELRVSEGCVSVEMEAAAFFAVAEFRGVKLGQILYGGDDLSGETWDSRKWQSRDDVRDNLVDLSLEICLEIN